MKPYCLASKCYNKRKYTDRCMITQEICINVCQIPSYNYSSHNHYTLRLGQVPGQSMNSTSLGARRQDSNNKVLWLPNNGEAKKPLFINSVGHQQAPGQSTHRRVRSGTMSVSHITAFLDRCWVHNCTRTVHHQ